MAPVSVNEEEPNLKGFDQYYVAQIRRRNVNTRTIVMSPKTKVSSFAAEFTLAFVE